MHPGEPLNPHLPVCQSLGDTLDPMTVTLPDECVVVCGRSVGIEELAEGFLQIAVANMVRAIRNISVARGYDPADYVLVTFGGAGGQHACAIARELGIRDVLVHPYAGILSAYGMGLADVRRFGQQSVLRPLDSSTLEDLEQVEEQPLLRPPSSFDVGVLAR